MIKLSNIQFTAVSIFRCSVAVSAAQSIFRLLFIFPYRSSAPIRQLNTLPIPLPQLRAAGSPHAVSVNLTSPSDPYKPSHTVNVSRFIHVVACVSISFLKTKPYSSVCVCLRLSISRSPGLLVTFCYCKQALVKVLRILSSPHFQVFRFCTQKWGFWTIQWCYFF